MFNRGPVTAVVTIGLAIAIIVLMGISRPARIPDGFDAADRDVTSPGVESQHGQPVVEPRLLGQAPGFTQSMERVGTIRFFDGETAEVRLRPMPTNNVAYPERLSSKLEEWKNAALQGDADVARMLYKSLNNCRGNIYESDEEFAVAIDQFQQTHVIERNVAGHPVPMDEEPTAEILAHLRQSYEFCKGIKEDDIQAADSWLELAADNGNVLETAAVGAAAVTRSCAQLQLQAAPSEQAPGTQFNLAGCYQLFRSSRSLRNTVRGSGSSPISGNVSRSRPIMVGLLSRKNTLISRSS